MNTSYYHCGLTGAIMLRWILRISIHHQAHTHIILAVSLLLTNKLIPGRDFRPAL